MSLREGTSKKNPLNPSVFKRHTAVELAVIKKDIYDKLIAGYTNRDLVNYFREKSTFNTDAIALYHIQEVKKEFLLNIEEDLRLKREEYIAKYMALYKDSKEFGEIKDAKAILDSLVKLEGLTQQKVEVKDDEHIITITF